MFDLQSVRSSEQKACELASVLNYVATQSGSQTDNISLVRMQTLVRFLFIFRAISAFSVYDNKHILVVGGSGRVGGSVVQELVRKGAGRVSVGGTNVESYQQALNRWNELNEQFPEEKLTFCELDRHDAETVKPHLDGVDLVIHTAGPFQNKANVPNGILDACIQCKVAYMDVCDDYCTAKAAQTKYADQAEVPCIVSTGTWPGVSSLMAKQLVLKQDRKPEDLKVDFSFFTAGSGGAGVTLLVATFLILAEPALQVIQGRRKTVPPLQDWKLVDFGPIVGAKSVAPLNLLETASVHDNLGVGSTSATFGTAPGYWNALLGVFGNVVPKAVVENEDWMRALSIFSMPIVRAVDLIAGATNAIRVDVYDEADTVLASAVYAHENLEPCVGESITAFATAILEGKVAPGVWFPEDAIVGEENIAAVLAEAGKNAHTLSVEGNVQTEDVFGSRAGMAAARQAVN